MFTWVEKCAQEEFGNSIRTWEIMYIQDKKQSKFPDDRKSVPLCTGVLDYFPDALIEVAKVSVEGNKQHNPGEPLHWAKEKSTDHADCIMRHLVDRGKFDADGTRHSAKIAWRALALLQIELEQERAKNEQAPVL